MKKLQLQYKKNGYNHRQVYRQDDIAIYELISPETGRILGYEVFEVQHHSERIINGRMIETSEGSPSNEQWGGKGFTVWQFSAAMEKAKRLLVNRDKRNLEQCIGFKST